MAVKGWHIAGGLVGLYLLCKSGKIPEPLQFLCNPFKGGLPGGTLLAPGGSVDIGTPEMDLSALIAHLDRNGIGTQELQSEMEPGDWFPRDLYRIGWKLNTTWGERLEIVGYCRMFNWRGGQPVNEIGYRTRSSTGTTSCTTADSFNPNAKWTVVT